MSAPSIPAARMAQLDSRECRQLLNQAMACRTSLEVEHLPRNSHDPTGRTAGHRRVHQLAGK